MPSSASASGVAMATISARIRLFVLMKFSITLRNSAEATRAVAERSEPFNIRWKGASGQVDGWKLALVWRIKEGCALRHLVGCAISIYRYRHTQARNHSCL